MDEVRFSVTSKRLFETVARGSDVAAAVCSLPVPGSRLPAPRLDAEASGGQGSHVIAPEPSGLTGCSLERTLAARRIAEASQRRLSSGRGQSRLGTGKHVRELPAGLDTELREHVAQMPLDGPRAQEEPRTDLRI